MHLNVENLRAETETKETTHNKDKKTKNHAETSKKTTANKQSSFP